VLLRRAVLGALVVSSLAACSTDPRALDSGELRQLIVRGLERADRENALHFTEGEARCTADRVMEAISDDRLKDLGVDEGFGLSTLDFTPAEQAEVFAALEDCVDLVAQVAETLGTDAGLTDDEARCVAGRYVSSGPFREAIFAERFDPALNERIDRTLAEAAQDCDVAGRTIPS
jgi:hypothetical protein